MKKVTTEQAGNSNNATHSYISVAYVIDETPNSSDNDLGKKLKTSTKYGKLRIKIQPITDTRTSTALFADDSAVSAVAVEKLKITINEIVARTNK